MIIVNIISAFLLFFVVIILFTESANSCNEYVCASVVSKCMLTQSCKCDLKHCSCCKECLNCLSFLYSECCSCVDLCPKPNETLNVLSKKSHVEDFEGIPGLFNTLTAIPDEEKWTTFTFPVDFDSFLLGPKFDKDVKYFMKSNEQDEDSSKILERGNVITVNCTVIYLTQCLSWNKCRQNCESMGANSYRWFHDGCCECVGSTCINYGINESRCLNCPELKDNIDLEDTTNEDWLEYGEEMESLEDNFNHF